MSGTFRFIHAADLHLGSFLNINGKPQKEIRDLCREAVYAGFERICYKAISFKVDFILLCGDVYDSYLRSVRGNRFFVNQCLRLGAENISVYVIYGNHDAIEDKSELFTMPQNVHILNSDSVETFEVHKDGEVIAKIIGKSYKRRNEKEKIYESYLVDNNVFNIAMLHTALEGNNKNYVPCTLEELLDIPNIDYWALGHIHKSGILHNTKPIIAFPGIPQGRDMGEQGEGGVFLVTVNRKEIIEMQILPISTIIYKRLEIVIDDNKIENYSDLVFMIVDKVSTLTDELPEASDKTNNSRKYLPDEFKGHILQLVIKGRTEMHGKITNMNEDDYKQFLEEINSEVTSGKYFLWIDSIVFRTSPLIQDFEDLKLQNSIFKDLEEVIKLYTEDDVHKSELVKNFGSIWKEQIYTENIEEDKFDFNEEIIEDIILQAKELLIEKLAEVLEIE